MWHVANLSRSLIWDKNLTSENKKKVLFLSYYVIAPKKRPTFMDL